MYVSLVEPDQLSPDLRATWEKSSDGGKAFVAAMAHAPEHAERLFPYYTGIRFGTSIGAVTCELLRLAIAQTTQCPACLRGRRADAVDEGMTERQVAALSGVDRSDFTLAQAAVVDFALKFGADHFAIAEEDFRRLREHYDEQQVVEIGMLCAQFLGFGRLVMVLGLDNPVCPLPTSGHDRIPVAAAKG
jgi:AhpD family alkylhydroperoxidase